MQDDTTPGEELTGGRKVVGADRGTVLPQADTGGQMGMDR